MADPSTPATSSRRNAVRDLKRGLILDAARALFAEEGFEGASLRAIAVKAGYTPAALYFHFASKEAIYAALLEESLLRLQQRVAAETAEAVAPPERLRAAAMAFYGFYAEHRQDLDLGFYLLRGGMRPRGLGPEYDPRLNAMLLAALAPITEAAEAMGAAPEAARAITADIFAHATGLLLMLHTRRIKLFAADPAGLMRAHLDKVLASLADR